MQLVHLNLPRKFVSHCRTARVIVNGAFNRKDIRDVCSGLVVTPGLPPDVPPPPGVPPPPLVVFTMVNLTARSNGPLVVCTVYVMVTIWFWLNPSEYDFGTENDEARFLLSTFRWYANPAGRGLGVEEVKLPSEVTETPKKNQGDGGCMFWFPGGMLLSMKTS